MSQHQLVSLEGILAIRSYSTTQFHEIIVPVIVRPKPDVPSSHLRHCFKLTYHFQLIAEFQLTPIPTPPYLPNAHLLSSCNFVLMDDFADASSSWNCFPVPIILSKS